MTMFIFGLIVGAVAKVLLPWPYMDDKVREGWRYVAKKIP